MHWSKYKEGRKRQQMGKTRRANSQQDTQDKHNSKQEHATDKNYDDL